MERINSISNMREWAPLTDLLNKIPSKPNLNIFSEEVKITCVDVLPEFIALGTNYGMAYWYDRKTKELKRLRCENSNIPVTFIKVLSTVDFMLACGSSSGNISIFQIPKVHPDWIPEKLKPKNKSVERYTVSELHKSAITALEWSKNGMKLFSGDKDGTVVLTEIDFYMHICKSLEILNETYEVVQLSYSNPKLVVSTTYRSIICEQADKWTVMQVGRQDRKILGTFGGIIQQNKLKSKDAVIYCTRPGLRLWISNDQGVVQKTLVFKEILKKDCAEVPLLNPISKQAQSKTLKDVNFGVILRLGENFLVTYNNSLVYILDIENMTVVFRISHLRRVLDVACHNDEIFILEEDRSLIRISTRPEVSYDETNISSEEGLFLSNPIKGLTSKLQPSSILSVIPPVIGQTLINISEHTDEELIMNAEEAVEEQLNTQVEEPPKRFDNVEVDDSTEILYKHKKTKKKRPEKQILENRNDEREENICITQPTLMTMSTVGQLPDLRSPQTILSSIEQKEKLLAAFLTYDKRSSNDPLKENESSELYSKTVQESNIPTKDNNDIQKTERLEHKQVGTNNISNMKNSEYIKDENNTQHKIKQIGQQISPTEQIQNKNKMQENSEKPDVKEKRKDKSITDKIDYGGIIDIDKILNLQETRTSEFKENLKTKFSNGKVMKKSQTSVINDNVSFFGFEEKKQPKSKFDKSSINESSTSSKSKNESKTKPIPIMSKSTEIPARADVSNRCKVFSLERKNSCSDELLKDWVIL